MERSGEHWTDVVIPPALYQQSCRSLERYYALLLPGFDYFPHCPEYEHPLQRTPQHFSPLRHQQCNVRRLPLA